MIEIIDKYDCCGCSACVQTCPVQCIAMEEDIEGFLYPLFNKDKCIKCNRCSAVCPVINQDISRKPLKVYAAKSINEDIRLESSSGGVFTLFAESIIKKDGVVFGARFNEQWEVVHDYTEDIEGLSIFRGSKYVQSVIGNSYNEVKAFLNDNRQVLFCGTPCQVAGLKKFLNKEYENLLTIDFVCHGVPSPKVWSFYLKELLENHNREFNDLSDTFSPTSFFINNISFRNKKRGWKNYDFVINYLLINNSSELCEFTFSELHNENIFMKGFLSDLYLRPSCYKCPSKCLKSQSDITIGDYWGIEDILPTFDDNKGVSLILINNLKAVTVFNNLNVKNVVSNYLLALKKNPVIERSVNIPVNRKKFFSKFESENIINLINICTRKTFINRIKHYAFILVLFFKNRF